MQRVCVSYVPHRAARPEAGTSRQRRRVGALRARARAAAPSHRAQERSAVDLSMTCALRQAGRVSCGKQLQRTLLSALRRPAPLALRGAGTSNTWR